MSAASLRHAPVGRAPQVPVALAEGAGSGDGLFFGAFLLVHTATQKKGTAPPGAIPAGDASKHPEAVYANPPIGAGAQMRDKHVDSLLSYMQTKSAWFQVG